MVVTWTAATKLQDKMIQSIGIIGMGGEYCKSFKPVNALTDRSLAEMGRMYAKHLQQPQVQ